jgi:hypothetical protein
MWLRCLREQEERSMTHFAEPDPVICLIEAFWSAEDERIRANRKQKGAFFSSLLQEEYSEALRKKEAVFQVLSSATPLSRRGAIEMLSVALSEVHTHRLPTQEHYSPSVCHPYAIEVLHRVRDFLESSSGGQET